MYFQLCSASLQRRKAAGKEGTGTNGCGRSQSLESCTGLIPRTPPQGSKSGHHVPPEQPTVPVCGQCPGAMQCLASVTQRHFQDHYRAFVLWKTAPGPCTPHPAGRLSLLAQVSLPVFHSSQRKSSSRHWGRACSCHELIFFPMLGQALGKLLPFQHIRSCSKVWALLLRARQVTSHVLTCGLLCREEGCC